jgi:VWFA-related protein
MRAAASAFVGELLPADRARIGTFGAEIAISPRLTGDRAYLHRVIEEEIWPGGPTPLWDSIDAAMSSLDDEKGRRVVLLLTDGYDSFSRGPDPTRMARAGTIVGPATLTRSRFDEVMDRANRGQFMMYGVSFGAATRSSGTLMGDPLSVSLKLMIRDTGGGFHEFETTKDAADAMVEVAEELHHQYLLGFEPVSADGKLHRLDVRIKRSGVSATARQSYMAAKK